MSAEFNIKLNSFQEEVKRFGIQRPPITRETVEIDGITVQRLTEQSEKDWADYLRAVTQAKIAANK